jgi:hypothetical protein
VIAGVVYTGEQFIASDNDTGEHLPPKNHNLFVKLGSERELEKKELRPQANNAQYDTQGRRV